MEINVQYNPALHLFTVTEGKRLLATGKVKKLENTNIPQAQSIVNNNKINFSKNEIYRKLRISGYQYCPKFQNICNSDQNGKSIICSACSYATSTSI